MKIFVWQILILGGFYFILSSLFSLDDGAFFDAANLTIFIVFIVMLLVLCFKRKYEFLIHFQDRFLKITNYLSALGIAQYFGTIFVAIPGDAYGYKASIAQYNGAEAPVVPVAYLQITSYVYWGVLFLALIWATYQSFIKNKLN